MNLVWHEIFIIKSAKFQGAISYASRQMSTSNFMLFGIAPPFSETLLTVLVLVIINQALYCSLHHFRELWKYLLLLVVGLTVRCSVCITSVPTLFLRYLP